jgi:hypothetical protein
MSQVYKWADDRISEYLAIQGVDLTPEQYQKVLDEVDLWLFENIDKVIAEKVQEVL